LTLVSDIQPIRQMTREFLPHSNTLHGNGNCILHIAYIDRYN
jgi:hypothetical protein